MPHAVSESQSAIRSYSTLLPGPSLHGVAALSWYPDEAPQCLFSDAINACHNASYAPAAAQSIVGIAESLPDLSQGFSGINLACSLLYQQAIANNDVSRCEYIA